ncbi:MAG: ATP-binding protein [bacterium]|nr:ATP-binding protein [bacterium]
MIDRPEPLKRIRQVFRVHPIAALLGPRQCGKTTVARAIAAQEPCTFFDLESPVDLQRLSAPMTALEELEDLVVIDEIQRKPELFELLRVLVDRPENKARFLVLGSASPSLVKGVSESLAGRVGFVDLSGFILREVGTEVVRTLWHRGGFPRSYLAPDAEASYAWRQDFVRTFLERDIPQLGITVPAETLRRFWTMIAHFHGQVWNAAQFGRSLGSSESTARRYLDILSGAFMVRVLPPWFENLKKRQVKAPKLYLRDSGLLHALLQLETMHAVLGHPKLGASWEGFALEHIITVLGTRDAYFWATHSGAELDLLVLKSGRRFGFELKYSDAPSMTRSMQVASNDLQLDRLWVVYPGSKSYDLRDRVSVIPLERVQEAIRSAL